MLCIWDHVCQKLKFCFFFFCLNDTLPAALEILRIHCGKLQPLFFLFTSNGVFPPWLAQSPLWLKQFRSVGHIPVDLKLQNYMLYNSPSLTPSTHTDVCVKTSVSSNLMRTFHPEWSGVCGSLAWILISCTVNKVQTNRLCLIGTRARLGESSEAIKLQMFNNLLKAFCPDHSLGWFVHWGIALNDQTQNQLSQRARLAHKATQPHTETHTNHP